MAFGNCFGGSALCASDAPKSAPAEIDAFLMLCPDFSTFICLTLK